MDALTQQTSRQIQSLVLRAKKRDADAFAELIGRYERMALSVAFSVLNNADAAGDVVQEAFLRAWQRLDELKDPARFATWLCGIARNLAIDQCRRGRHMKLSVDSTGFDDLTSADERLSPSPLDELDRREQRALVAEALESLDELTRSTVMLRYYDGRSSKEIGEALGLSPAAVDMRLSRARQQLKQQLGGASLPAGK
ncbi:MAG TPA: sigma-70 family RNA polymerase sigma factor [Tepidisphaeraceae bacterium]|nr:sigma-70 family RNA polymerase sigma factor [Tepidisphaeraceae bacterium]